MTANPISRLDTKSTFISKMGLVTIAKHGGCIICWLCPPPPFFQAGIMMLNKESPDTAQSTIMMMNANRPIFSGENSRMMIKTASSCVNKFARLLPASPLICKHIGKKGCWDKCLKAPKGDFPVGKSIDPQLFNLFALSAEVGVCVRVCLGGLTPTVSKGIFTIDIWLHCTIFKWLKLLWSLTSHGNPRHCQIRRLVKSASQTHWNGNFLNLNL